MKINMIAVQGLQWI